MSGRGPVSAVEMPRPAVVAESRQPGVYEAYSKAADSPYTGS